MEMNQQEWFVSSSELDSQEVITKGRRFLQEIKNSGHYNERIEIEWSYKPMANGMPTEEQDKFMNDIAFKLKDALEADKTAYLTSIYTGRNSFFMIFYTSSVEKFARILHQVLAEYEQLPLQIGKADDPQWEEYTEMLEQNNFKE